MWITYQIVFSCPTLGKSLTLHHHHGECQHVAFHFDTFSKPFKRWCSFVFFKYAHWLPMQSLTQRACCLEYKSNNILGVKLAANQHLVHSNLFNWVYLLQFAISYLHCFEEVGRIWHKIQTYLLVYFATKRTIKHISAFVIFINNHPFWLLSISRLTVVKSIYFEVNKEYLSVSKKWHFRMTF